MFIYENGNSLNLTFEGSIPVENPDIVIKGYEDGTFKPEQTVTRAEVAVMISRAMEAK